MALSLGFLALLVTTESANPALPPFAISAVQTHEPALAITFDACATSGQANGFDRAIFEILLREQIPVTFYLSGRWVETHLEAARAMAEAPWSELGNHTYVHPRLTQVDLTRVQSEIQRTNEILANSLGRTALSLRPPGGAWDESVVRLARKENLPVVLWSVVSGDAGGHIPADRMVTTVLDQARSGSIIIFHINERAPFTKEALPAILAGLRHKGFRFVTVSQLLELADAVPIKAKRFPTGYHPGNKGNAAEPKNGESRDASPPI